MLHQRFAAVRILLIMAVLVLLSTPQWTASVFRNQGVVQLVRAATGCDIAKTWPFLVDRKTPAQCPERSVALLQTSISALERSIQWQPSLSASHRHLAEAHLLLGSFDQALGHFEQATRLNHQDDIAYFRLGQVRSATGKEAQAAAAWQQAGAAQFFLQQGKEYVTQRRYAEAEQYLSLAVRIDPQLGEGYWRLGEVQRILGKTQQAAWAYHRAGDLEQSDTARKYAMLGMAYGLEGQFAQAIESYERAIALNPTSGPYYFDLAVVLLEAGDREQAIQVLEQGTRAVPNYYYLRRLLGDAYRDQNKCSEAIYWYQQAIQLDAKAYSPWLGIGQCRYAQAKWSEAVEALRMAQVRNPQDPGVHYWLGQSYVQLGKFQEAVDAFEQAIQFKEDYRYHLALGDVFYSQGEFQQALGRYSRVLELDPDNPLARQRVQELSRKQEP